jgi:epoxide hydrolase 4
MVHRFILANGLRFHCVDAGSGPLVLLLHGFPEFWYGWRRQIPALARGFRVVAPDLRGYNLTDKPARGYDLRTLVGDVVGLVDALGEERASVVGHDWGGVVAWGTAMWEPERVERLAILNAPHPGAYFRELRRNPRQLLRSWYVGLFQLPGLPEWVLGRRRCRGIAELLRRSAIVPEAFSDADLAHYRRAMCRPGALHAALAYYRAFIRTPPRQLTRQLRPTTVPTLVVWGEQDAALVPELADGLEAWAPNLRVRRVPDAGHWVQHERPDLVNRLLLEFLAGGT